MKINLSIGIQAPIQFHPRSVGPHKFKKIPPMRPTLLPIVATVGLFTGASHAVVLIQDDFTGLAANTLSGTSPGTYAAGLTAAGGSSTWSANTSFRANGAIVAAGSVDNGMDGAASLTLGTYITSARNTASGRFTMTATIAGPTGGNADNSTWVSVGFFNNPIAVGGSFFAGTGQATSLTRRVDSSDYFAGPATNNSLNVINGTGTRTFTTVLDLTPAGGYNGTNNYGTVTFFSDNGPAAGNSFTYTTQQNFTGIGFTFNNEPNSALSNFTLEQVPEPSAAMLGALGVLSLLRRRK